MKKALIFLPEAQVYPYAYTFGIFGDALKQSGYEVYVSDCNGFVNRCPIVVINKTTTEDDLDKKSYCNRCKSSIDFLTEKFGFIPCHLVKYITADDRKEISDLFSCEISDWGKISYDGCAIGQLAIGDLMRECKVLDTDNLSREEVEIYKQYIFTMASVICAFRKIVIEYNLDLVLAFNPYVQNQAVQWVCQKYGISFRYLSNEQNQGSDYSLFTITKEFSLKARLEHIQKFCTVSNRELTYDQARFCYDDAAYKGFFSGSHIFSTQKTNNTESILKYLNFDINKKTIGVFTSSYDEPLGNAIYFREWGIEDRTSGVFPVQVEWLEYLKDYATRNESVQIVVRIHPREAQTGESYHVKLLKSRLIDLPSNYKIIWPEEKISSYDLFDIIDLCLISNSTMGLECYRQGIPVVGYIKNSSYPNEGLFYVASNKQEYERAIDSYIIGGLNTSIEDLKKAARFYYWNCLDFNTILKNYICGGVPNGNYSVLPKEPACKVVEYLEDKITKKQLNDYLYPAVKTDKTEVNAALDGIKNLLYINVYQMLGLSLYEKNFCKTFLFKLIRKFLLLISFKCIRLEFKPDKRKCFDNKELRCVENIDTKTSSNEITYQIKSNGVDVKYKNTILHLQSKLWKNLLSIYKDCYSGKF